MNGMSGKATGISGLPLVIVLSLSMMSGAWAAAMPAAAANTAAAPTAEQLQELDEIWIRGKSLSRVISEAEDAFFVAYNKVNRNYAFSIHCGEVSINPGSMIMQRACVPGFVADAYYGSRAGYASPQTFYSGCAMGGGLGSGTFNGAGVYCGGSWGVSIPPMDTRPSASALIAARSNELAVHMMMLINRDPQLKQMAGQLDDLHREFQSMRTRYDRIRPADPDAKVRINRGPRVL
jgi:hypothetical protein